MKLLDLLYRWFGYVKGLGLFSSGIALLLMIVLITADVVMRNFVGRSISGVYEVVGFYLMPLSVLPILFYAFAGGISPRIPMLVDRLSDKVQKIIYTCVLCIEMVLMLLVAWYSLGYAMDGMAGSHAFPAGGQLYAKYPAYFLVPAAFFGMAIEIAFTIMKNILKTDMWVTYVKDQATLKSEQPM